MADVIRFVLNGRPVEATGDSPTTTLLQWLRAHHLTGTKEGCAEGDCGACTVALREADVTGRPVWQAVNSCLLLLPMCEGRELRTVEGLADGALHPVQSAMIDHLGAQCGYCTPGFVMSMFEGYHRAGDLSDADLADQLCGNLCRCTGYRPIRDAMRACRDRRDPAADERFRLPTIPDDAPAPWRYDHRGARWDRPTSLDALLRLRADFPDAPLVMGATEIAVEVNKKAKAFPHLISVEAVGALRAVVREPEAIWVGGAASLTALEDALGDAFPALTKMLRVFASRQIRHRASVAGNLVTASPIGDLAPVLLAVDAEVSLRSVRGARTLPLQRFFTGYRATALAPDEVLEGVTIPLRPRDLALTRVCESYKVSKRRELDISIVAACFRVDLDAAGVVRGAGVGLGGVAATPVRVTAVEEFLVGRRWAADTAREAAALLGRTVRPIDDVRATAEYRRALCESLFEKFFAGERSAAQDAPLDFVPGPGVSVADESRALRHDNAVEHVTGAARYVDDTGARRDALTLWPVTSPHAHARVLSIDTADALACEGVVAVLTARDIPGMNDVGAVRHDETLLAADEVMFHGHMVAVVVGRDPVACRAAAQRVRVTWEVLPAVLGIPAAVAAESYHTNESRIVRGDVEAALRDAPHTLDGEIDIGGQEHLYLETQAAFAELDGDGGVTVLSSTQHPSEIQAVVAHVLDLPRSRVVVQSPRMGGGFGGKETQGNTWAALAALAAVKTGRPVRVQLDRDVDMALTGKRHPMHARYRVGFEPDGQLTGLDVRMVSDGGWALDLSESILDRALFHLDNAYFVPHARFVGRVARTNTVSHTAFRGFGGPQGMVVVEEVIDRIARHLGLSPEAVRARNFYTEEGGRDVTHYGQRVEHNRLPAVWSAVLRESDFAARRAEVDAFNATSPWVKRGLAVTPVKFGISFTATFLNQAGALVVIYRDGSVQVNHGGTEMGQGLHAKILGVAMRELGVRAGRLRMMRTQTDKVPNTSATAASAGADLNGAAVREACVTLRERLTVIAAKILGCAPEEVTARDDGFWGAGREAPFAQVVERAYFAQIPLSATGFYRTPDIAWDKSVGQGRPFYYFAYGAAVTEVEVDGRSGMKRVLRTDIVHDVGDSLNPAIDRGQVEGAYVQGLGWLTGEELSWDAQGRLRTHSVSTYQIPAISDAPRDLRVTLLPHAPQPGTIHGSKAVGEPPLMLAISAREAIRDAVGAFGAPGGDVNLRCPATHEAIHAAVRARMADRPRATGSRAEAGPPMRERMEVTRGMEME
jgi:xanthine dehydrogenase molybdopterin binding subunit/xanthine dehydrogenase small subunit